MAALAFTGVILLSSMFSQAKELHVNAQLMKMNVVYAGVDNPVVISIPGIPPENIRPSIEGDGSIRNTLQPGAFVITVNRPGTVKLNVSVAGPGPDSAEVIQSFIYRAKDIPDPVTFINNISNDGVILKENLPNISGVFTRMVNFDFDGAFHPVSFSMSVIENGEWKEYEAIGPALTPEMKTALSKSEEEDKIIFHNVMTKGPAGDVRHVNSVTITVK